MNKSGRDFFHLSTALLALYSLAHNELEGLNPQGIAKLEKVWRCQVAANLRQIKCPMLTLNNQLTFSEFWSSYKHYPQLAFTRLLREFMAKEEEGVEN